MNKEGTGAKVAFEKFRSPRNQKVEPHYKFKWNFEFMLHGYTLCVMRGEIFLRFESRVSQDLEARDFFTSM